MTNLLDRLNAQPGLWRSRIIESLAQSLFEIGDADELHDLIRDSQWAVVRSQGAGHYGTFLDDVELAWKLAEAPEDPAPLLIGRQVHYALLRTGVRSLAGNIPPSVLQAGLNFGLWSGEAALHYARQIPEPIFRVEALTYVGAFLREGGQEDRGHEALQDALIGLREIEAFPNYVDAFITLVPHLPPELVVDALFTAQEIHDLESRVRVLLTVFPRLPSEWLGDALLMVHEMKESDEQAYVLAALAPYLPPDLLRGVIQRLQAGYSSSKSAIVLAALAPYLLLDLVPLAAKIAESLSSPLDRAVARAPYIAGTQPDKAPQATRDALSAIRRANDIDDRARGLILLAPHLPADLLPEALEIARKIGDSEVSKATCAKTLVALAPSLPSQLHPAVLDIVRGWPVLEFRRGAEVLAALAPQLSYELLVESLHYARHVIQVIYYRDKDLARAADRWPSTDAPTLLKMLAPHLPPDLFPEGLDATREIADEAARCYALIALAPYLPPELIPEAAAMARQLTKYGPLTQAMPLAALSLRGRSSLLDEALDILESSQEADESVVALPVLLTSLAHLLPPEDQAQTIEHALHAARGIASPRWRAEALTRIAMHVPTEQKTIVLAEAVIAARRIDAPLYAATALVRLVPLLSPEHRPGVVAEALVAATNVPFDDNTDNLIVAKATLLPLLASYLPPPLIQEALEAVQAVADPALRGYALAQLAPHVPSLQRPDVLAAALQAAREVDEPWGPPVADRFKILALVAPQLPPSEQTPVFAEALALVRKSGSYEAFPGELGTALAALIPHLPASLYSEASALARQVGSTEALMALVPQVPADQRAALVDEALIAARGIVSPPARAPALARLAAHVEGQQRADLVELVLATMPVIVAPSNRQEALQELALAWTQLPRQLAYGYWKRMLRESTSQRRSVLISDIGALVPVIAGLGGDAALLETLRAIQEVSIRQLPLSNRPTA